MFAFENDKEQPLKKALNQKAPFLSEIDLKKLFEKKDIKVNGTRCLQNIMLKPNDKVEVFLDLVKVCDKKIKVVFEDENVVVIDKPYKMQVVSYDTSEITATTLLNLTRQVFAVHRLDTNTQGLVVFAKNQNAKCELERAFKQNLVKKQYVCIAYSAFLKSKEFFEDYLTKDDKNSLVKVFAKEVENSLLAKLDYEVVAKRQNFAMLKVNLQTGRTHQIRAQLAFHKIYILGDGKYGDKNINRKFDFSFQLLQATKIEFCFEDNSFLHYLNDLHLESVPKFSLDLIF